MDDHMNIADMARTIGLPVEQVRIYAERYSLYLPVVRTGADVWYPPESVTLIAEIDQAVGAGATESDIETSLQDYIPSMRLVRELETAQPDPSNDSTTATLSYSLDDLAKMMIDQQSLITEMIRTVQSTLETVATADQFHGLRAETASLAAALAMRDSQFEHANAMLLAELRQAVNSLKSDIAGLQAGVQQSQLSNETVQSSPEGEATSESSDAPKSQQTDHERDNRHRTPRRMGQPLKLNGLNGIGKN